LKKIAAEHECRIMFMPHPNLEDYLPELTLPDHVEVRSYSEINVQDVIAQSAVVVTDYSSIAFDAAIVRRPVVYYQFDRAKVFGGGHTTEPGYFSYQNGGFGPVALEHDQVLEALNTTLANGREPAPEYMRRIERTFVAPGHACSRVTEMIEELDRPVKMGDHRPTPEAPEIQYTNSSARQSDFPPGARAAYLCHPPPHPARIVDDLLRQQRPIESRELGVVDQQEDDVSRAYGLIQLGESDIVPSLELIGQAVDIGFDRHNGRLGEFGGELADDLPGRTLAQVIDVRFESQAQGCDPHVLDPPSLGEKLVENIPGLGIVDLASGLDQRRLLRGG